MALVIKDRIKETTTTTSTGSYSLAGAKTGFQSFSVIGDGNTCYYACTDGTDFEIGVGTYTSSNSTLARTTILESSNSDAAVDWSAGSKDIFVTAPADKIVYEDASGNITVSGTVDGVDIAARDAVLTSTTTTANAAMPLSGGTFTGDVTILNTGDGSFSSPYFNLKRDSASPAAWDYLGAVRFLGEDGASNETPYASILGRIVDPTSGSEDGRFELWQQKAGTGTLTYVFDHDAFQLQNEQPIKWKEHHGTAYDVFVEPATPTATRTITLPDATGTVLLSDGDGSNLTNVQAASVNVTESADDNVTYNVLFSDTSGTGNVQMTPVQDDNGITFNPSSNTLWCQSGSHQYVYVQDYIYHSSDTDTNIRFETDSIKLSAGSTTPLKVTTGKTTFDGAIEEETRTSSGSGSMTLNGDYGTIWEITSSGTWTFTDGLTDGESVTVLIDQSSGSTVTWPTVTWLNSSSAPTLSSNINTFVFFKVGTTLYGALVGDQT